MWASGAALAALGGILLGLAEQVSWELGFQLLLLMFAGVTLGRPRHRLRRPGRQPRGRHVRPAVDPGRRRPSSRTWAPCCPHPHPARPTAGHPRAIRAGRVGSAHGLGRHHPEHARAAVGREAIVYALAAIGLNIHFGYTGLLNFGQVGFMAVGAYGVASPSSSCGLPLWVGVLMGIGGSVVLALLLGLPDPAAAGRLPGHRHHRRRRDHPAAVRRAPTLRDFTGGSDGLTGFAGAFYDTEPVPRRRVRVRALVNFERPQLWVLFVGWTLVLLASLLVCLLMRSPWGRVLKAIREDEDAVRALGKNVYCYKMQSLILGGVIGGSAA